MPNFELVTASDVVSLDKVSDPAQITTYSKQLTKREISQIVSGFNSASYEMVSLFVWTRSIAVLKNELAKLGMQFVGEMLGRPDITETSSVDVITESEAISLAESLSVVTPTEAMRLRQAQTVVSHFSKPRDSSTDEGGQQPNTDEEEGMAREEAISCLRACIKNILSRPSIQLAQKFVQFREKLSSATLTKNDPDLESLALAPYFFKKTTLNFLLAAAKSDQSAELTHILNNLNVILPEIWEGIRRTDKWLIGQSYAEAYSAGREVQVAGMKRALIQVRGFDFVPETTRSNTFAKAAQKVLSAHEGINNFYTEVPAITELRALGTVIPMPAFPVCIRAVLCVYLGNQWGYSWNGAAVAEQQINEITPDRWKYVFDECLPFDKTLLYKLGQNNPAQRWIALVKRLNLLGIETSNHNSRVLLQLSASDKISELRNGANSLANAVQ